MSYRTNKDQDFLDKVGQLQEEITEARREFFTQVGKGAAATAVATTAFHMGIRPYMKPLASNADAAIGSSVNSTIAGAAEGGWKGHFNIKPNYIYMNIGTTGSLPVTVLDQMEEWYYSTAESCASYASTADYRIKSTIVGSGATGYNAYGAKPQEILYTWTTSDGMIRLVSGIDWQSGDSVMATNMEHVGGLGPMYSMQNYYGVDATPKGKFMWVDQKTGAPIAGLNASGGYATDTNQTTNPHAVLVSVNMYDSDGMNYGQYVSGVVHAPTGIREAPGDSFGAPSYAQYLAEKTASNSLYDYDSFWFNYDTMTGGTVPINPLKNAISSAASDHGASLKAFVFSSPPYLTGIRFPEKLVCNYIDTLNGGKVVTVIDAAHLTGMINTNLHDMGCDFYAGSGHKWQCGPGQTGFAYIRNGVGGSGGTSTSWTLAADGETRSGTSPAYSSTKALPKYWVNSSTYRKYVSYANGVRDTAADYGGNIMSIGNNSIAINRSIYETINLWNTIGRQRIEDYVVYLAQRLRCHLANAPMVAGLLDMAENPQASTYTVTNSPSQSGIYGLGIDPRNKAGGDLAVPSMSTGPNASSYVATPGYYSMAEMLDPQANRSDMPVWAKCGLTPWNPWIYRKVADQAGSLADNNYGADYNFPLTPTQRTSQNTRSGQVLTYLNDRYGVFTRNTSAPNQCRFSDPDATVNPGKQTLYSLNNEANFGLNTSSTPLRWSTHLFHTVTEIDQVGEIFTIKNFSVDQELARMFLLN